ncbi:MAG: PilZ domain-containing protein [Proteobacteria bacterium]|nr:PilZ domain-containing protein [Pseudomonadota bacterium]
MAKNQDWSLDDDIKATLADIAAESATADSEPSLRQYAGLHHPAIPGSEPPKKLGPEHRQAIRYNVKWKIALIFEDQEHKPTFHGRTQDLSLSGTGMLTDTNINATASVIILLAPPPLHLGHRQKIIEIKAHQQYVVYSGQTKCWRLGFAFLEFKNDGFNLLRDRLLHHQPSIASPAVKTMFR